MCVLQNEIHQLSVFHLIQFSSTYKLECEEETLLPPYSHKPDSTGPDVTK